VHADPPIYFIDDFLTQEARARACAFFAAGDAQAFLASLRACSRFACARALRCAHAARTLLTRLAPCVVSATRVLTTHVVAARTTGV
jgi:hypothetical protein